MVESFLSIIFFQSGYNTNIVLLCTLILGATAGVVGSFIYLRGRTLLSDAVSHATLPGIGIGFIIAFLLGLDGGRYLPALLAGAAITSILAALSVQWIRTHTRLNDDVAIGSVLSVFYGLGIVLLSLIQRFESASQAGLESFLLGQVTGISFYETCIIGLISLIVLGLSLLFLKEICLFCFDKPFSQSIGMPITKLDFLLIGLMIAVVCAGLKVVGLILILALLIIPPVTARLWTHQFRPMVLLSGALGALSCFAGASLSALFSNIPAGGSIALCASALFCLSLFFAPQRGIVPRYILRRRTPHAA